MTKSYIQIESITTTPPSRIGNIDPNSSSFREETSQFVTYSETVGCNKQNKSDNIEHSIL